MAPPPHQSAISDQTNARGATTFERLPELWQFSLNRMRVVKPAEIASGATSGLSHGNPGDSGCYSLIIALSRRERIRVGKFAVASFPAGTYIYTGSAFRGLASRLRRHCRREKKRHWHIDHLLAAAGARIEKIVVYPPVPGQECRQNQRIARRPGATVILPGFGASDCRAGCASHLFFFAPRIDHPLVV